MPPPNDSPYYGGRTTSFYETLTAAVSAMTETGYISAEQVAFWVDRIRLAAITSLTPPSVLRESLNNAMRAVYRSHVEKGGLLKFHPGVERFTLARVAPRLRAELDRRILASAALIKANRDEAIETTLRRFAGWATSIPPGGSEAVDKRDTKAEIRKPLAQLPFKERRVVVDQGHKFVANLNNIMAQDAGAIALIWRSHWRQQNYDYREDHKERDGRVYMIRGNWAQERGLVKVGDAGYYDDITAVGEEVFCRCFATYLYSLRRLPDDMLTNKGREELAGARMAA